MYSADNRRKSLREAFLFRYEERQDFDVLLLHIVMTGMDGVALAQAQYYQKEEA